MNLNVYILCMAAAFSDEQVLGATFVGCGAAIVAGGGATTASGISILFAGMYVMSMLFPAISSTLKERIFVEAREKFTGRELDVFVVNTFSSIAQVCTGSHGATVAAEVHAW